MLHDLRAPDINFVICGTAAGHISAARSAYYAGSGNKFWKTLFETGLTPRQLAPPSTASCSPTASALGCRAPA